jgi:hypothetical protein
MDQRRLPSSSEPILKAAAEAQQASRAGAAAAAQLPAILNANDIL